MVFVLLGARLHMRARTATLDLHLRELAQLFNSMDPSPFHDKDLDADAERFIVDWACDPHHQHHEYRIKISLATSAPNQEAQALVPSAISNYFAYEARVVRGALGQMMRDGRWSLLIGFLFISVCTSVASWLVSTSHHNAVAIVAEGITVAGWVALWHPMNVFLYEWWPLYRKISILERLSRAKIVLVNSPHTQEA
jgi:hypothetical protein